MLSFIDLMSSKPTNTSSKDLDDVIQATHEHIEYAINHIHHQMDERFHISSQIFEQQLWSIPTRMDNQHQIMDYIHEYIIIQVTNLLARSGVQ